MTDNEIKQLVTSNAKAIEALTNALTVDREERRKETIQLYQYLGRIASAQSNFYEIQADYYHQLATLSEKQTRLEERQIHLEERQIRLEERIIKIMEHLSLNDDED